MRGRLVVLGVVAVALIGAGCGQSDEDAVEETLKTYLTAFADGDGETACDQLAASARRELVDLVSQQLPELDPLDCESNIEKITQLIDEGQLAALRDVEISDVEVSGDTATATPNGGTEAATLRKIDGEWKMARLTGTAAASADTAGEGPQPVPDVEPDVEVEAEPRVGPLDGVRTALEAAGFAVEEEESSDSGIEAKLVAEDVNILQYTTSSAAQSGAREIERAIVQASPDRGLVEVRGRRVYWVGQERALTADERTTFERIVGLAEGS